MFNFKDLINRFDRIMSAITFAEADEREKALDILYDIPKKTKKKRVGSRITRQEDSRPDLRL
ncbi:MAG: hypothetical protein JRJ41_10500 [Deltaproteobacteria bacterium]|jgi:hypothetical protein|nr:hypothetical protein [Deltaproteobacteria bacterium]